MSTMVLNQAQREVLNVMSCLGKDDDLYELKKLLVAFLNERLQKELDTLWNSGKLSQEKIEALGHEHLRTKYK